MTLAAGWLAERAGEWLAGRYIRRYLCTLVKSRPSTSQSFRLRVARVSPTAKYINCDRPAQIGCCISNPHFHLHLHTPTVLTCVIGRFCETSCYLPIATTLPSRCSPSRGSDCCGLCSYQTCPVLPRLPVFLSDRPANCTPVSSFVDMSNSPPAYLFVVRQVDRPTDRWSPRRKGWRRKKTPKVTSSRIELLLTDTSQTRKSTGRSRQIVAFDLADTLRPSPHIRRFPSGAAGRQPHCQHPRAGQSRR